MDSSLQWQAWPQIIIGLPVRTRQKYSSSGPRIAARPRDVRHAAAQAANPMGKKFSDAEAAHGRAQARLRALIKLSAST
jgi:hypothetical protein